MPELIVDGHALEYTDGGPASDPELVFLHEGLGSVGLWRSFPHDLAGRIAARAVVYSRHGYGRSDPLTAPRRPDYLHHEALVVLPEVRRLLGIDRPVLVGHSDGASIAVIHAGAGADVAALVLIAPHVFVEPRAVRGVESARRRFETTDLVGRMAAHHRDPVSTFLGWADVWTNPEFRAWNIEAFLSPITVPVLVIQGSDDGYGTIAQVEAVVSQVSGRVETLVVDGCGHAPHLESPAVVVDAVTAFVSDLGSGEGSRHPQREADEELDPGGVAEHGDQ